MTHGDELHKIMEVTKSSVTDTVSNGLAQARLTVKHRLHGAVLGKDAVPGRPVPIHFGIKVVAVQFLCSRLGIVVGVGCSGSQSRNKRQDLRRDGVNRRKYVARVLSAPSTTPSASGRRKDHSHAVLLGHV